MPFSHYEFVELYFENNADIHMTNLPVHILLIIEICWQESLVKIVSQNAKEAPELHIYTPRATQTVRVFF